MRWWPLSVAADSVAAAAVVVAAADAVERRTEFQKFFLNLGSG